MELSKVRTPNDLLRQERLSRGWSQLDVANRIGSDLKTVGRWERGATSPGPYLTQKLCQLYEKSPAELGLTRESSSLSSEDTSIRPQALTTVSEDSLLHQHSAVSNPPVHTWLSLIKRRRLALLSLILAVILLLALGTWGIARLFPTTMTPSHDPYTGVGALDLNDPLSSNTADWSTLANSEGVCAFQNGGYDITGLESGYMKLCLANSSYFGNLVYEAQLKIISGDCGGLALRANFPLLYYFIICQDGNYRLVRYDRDQASLRRVLVAATSRAIHRGYGNNNTIAVTANANTFNIYINQALIGHYTDNAYASGQIGLLVHTCRVVYADTRTNLCHAPTEVLFSNIKVWKI